MFLDVYNMFAKVAINPIYVRWNLKRTETRVPPENKLGQCTCLAQDMFVR